MTDRCQCGRPVDADLILYQVDTHDGVPRYYASREEAETYGWDNLGKFGVTTDVYEIHLTNKPRYQLALAILNGRYWFTSKQWVSGYAEKAPTAREADSPKGKVTAQAAGQEGQAGQEGNGSRQGGGCATSGRLLRKV